MTEKCCQTGDMSEFRMGSRMQRHDLHKLHALGNDFLVWFQPEVPDDAPETARAWCDRTTGIGADGLVIAIDDRVAPTFVLFNADGGRAEISGNGLRCFIHAVAARRGIDELDTVVVTDAGDRAASIAGALDRQATATVGMGAPKPGPSLDGIDIGSHIDYRRVDTVDVGNPHVVVQVADLSGHDIAEVGPALEQYFLPTGINVHLVQPTERGLVMKIWERGVGVTEACGSGACAAAAIASLERPEQETFVVEMPGGEATVGIGNELSLSGPSTYIAAIEPMNSTL